MRKETILKNGLTVITEEKKEQNSVTMLYLVNAGGDSEKEHPHGIAHFIEHNVFNGTKNRTKEQIQEEIYALGGKFNASTSNIATDYYTTVPKEEWKKGAEILTDMLFNSEFKPEMLEKEKKIVIQEIYGADDNFESFSPLFRELLKDIPERVEILGTVESVTGITRDDIVKFLKEFYQPKNMAFITRGNVNHEEICAFLEELTPEGTDVDLKPFTPFTMDKFKPAVVTRFEEERSQVQYRFLMYGPGAKDNDRYAITVLAKALGGGMDSRLFEKIREKNGMAYAVSLSAFTVSDYGLLGGYVATTPENIKTVETMIVEEFKDIKLNSITEKELEHTKKFLKGRAAINRDDEDYEISLLESGFIYDKYATLEDYKANIDAVTLEDVKRVANIYLDETKIAKYYLGPESLKDLI